MCSSILTLEWIFSSFSQQESKWVFPTQTHELPMMPLSPSGTADWRDREVEEWDRPFETPQRGVWRWNPPSVRTDPHTYTSSNVALRWLLMFLCSAWPQVSPGELQWPSLLCGGGPRRPLQHNCDQASAEGPTVSATRRPKQGADNVFIRGRNKLTVPHIHIHLAGTCRWQGHVWTVLLTAYSSLTIKFMSALLISVSAWLTYDDLHTILY